MKKSIAILSILALALLVGGVGAAEYTLTDVNDTAIIDTNNIKGESEVDVDNNALLYTEIRNRSNSGENMLVVGGSADDAQVGFSTGDSDASTTRNSDVNITDVNFQGLFADGGVLPETDLVGTDLDDTTVVTTNSTDVEEEYDVNNNLDEVVLFDQAVNSGRNTGIIGEDFDDSIFTGVTGDTSSDYEEVLLRRNITSIERVR